MRKVPGFKLRSSLDPCNPLRTDFSRRHKKMRPRPATRAALLVDVLPAVAQADGLVLPAGRTLRGGGRNAKVSQRARRTFRKPPGGSPSRTRRKTSALPQSVAPKTSHVCNGDTVLQEQNLRNGKSQLRCAQTVEDGNSLWKP
jgi:hypothetical protein